MAMLWQSRARDADGRLSESSHAICVHLSRAADREIGLIEQ